MINKHLKTSKCPNPNPAFKKPESAVCRNRYRQVQENSMANVIIILEIVTDIKMILISLRNQRQKSRKVQRKLKWYAKPGQEILHFFKMQLFFS